MPLFWITILVVASLGVGAFAGCTAYAWSLRNSGYESLKDMSCVQCCKPIAGTTLYNNILSGGYTFCSHECVIKCQNQRQEVFDAFEAFRSATVIELQAFKNEQLSSDALIKVQTDLLSNYELSEILLKKELKMYQDALQGMSTGASA